MTKYLTNNRKLSVFDKFKVFLNFDKILLFSGLALTQYISLIFILTQLSFYLDLTVNYCIFIASILLTIILLFFSLNFKNENSVFNNYDILKKTIIQVGIIICICVMCFIFSYFVGNYFIDDGYDSHAYHQPYTLFFVNGWNPLQGETPSLFEGQYRGVDQKNNTYPKAAELVGSYFLLLTGSLESVKGINILTFFSAFFLIFSAFQKFFTQKTTAFIIALISVLNPVWVMQSTQFYIDGFISQLFLILIALILLYIRGEDSPYILISFLLGSILLLNCKASSLLFVPILYLLFFSLLLIYKKDKLKPFYAICLIFFILSIITGYSPYITNYLTTSSPLGSEFSSVSAEDYSNTFSGYENSNIPGWIIPRLQFLLYLFSPPSEYYEGTINPFVFDQTHMNNLSGVNKVNGYGPIFGLIIIVTIISLILSFRSTHKSDTKILLICIFFIFLSVILHSACWWTRFVPQFYLIPVFATAIGLMNKNKCIKIVTLILLLLIIINISFVSYHSYTRSVIINDRIQITLSEIKNNAIMPVTLRGYYNNLSESGNTTPDAIQLLNERNIPWKLCENENKCPNNRYIFPFLFFNQIRFDLKDSH